MHTNNLSSSLQYTHVMLSRPVIAKVCFLTLQGMRQKVSFQMFLRKMSPNYLQKETF